MKALQLRSADKEANKLKTDLVDLRNKAEIIKHINNAAKAKQSKQYREAINQIQQARHLSAMEPTPTELDNLVKSIVTELCEEAKPFYNVNQKQYPQTLERIELALELQPNEQRLINLKKTIKDLENDPKTANVSGIWNTPGGAMLEFKDNGNVIVQIIDKRINPD